MLFQPDFVPEKSKIALTIRKKIVEENWLKAVVQMPPNIFATTGTNVSVIFIDKSKSDDTSILVDASKLGTKVKEGKNQKTLLSLNDEDKIINTINNNEHIEDFSIIVNRNKIIEKTYSFGAGQYFNANIQYSELSPNEFEEKMRRHRANLKKLFEEEKDLESKIFDCLMNLEYE